MLRDTIIMTMAQRIPKLEPASESREAPETLLEGEEKGERRQRIAPGGRKILFR